MLLTDGVKLALLVEPRPSPAIGLVLFNACRRLSCSWNITILHSDENREFVLDSIHSNRRLRAEMLQGRLRMELLRATIGTSSEWYSQMLQSGSFWSDLRADWVLTLQSDTWICGREKDPPVVKPYIGGMSYQRGSKSDAPFVGHMNGGFSLRNVKWVKICIKQMKAKKCSACVEDELFSMCMKHEPGISIFDLMRFSSDNKWTGCFDDGGQRVCPWGVHMPWGNGPMPNGELGTLEHVEERLQLYNYCPELFQLENSQSPKPLDGKGLRRSNQFAQRTKFKPKERTSEVRERVREERLNGRSTRRINRAQAR
ncbi:hypothetical protein CYMTET_17500 [Cymbomonas tetramitiformis]|uniref:DUF5672 domain-containing protein n=1 Tax=Cymbomonas tetramitiformis TaxID=36881 RepID=A0AAE0G9Z5_9CHLO|nr:hypothetical protein CYMTET_17500 [Cymbomonas tetramitiformis]